MDDQRLARVSIAAGVVASLAVGVPVLLDQLFGTGMLAGARAGWWWLAYTVHLAILIGYDVAVDRLPRVDGRLLLAVQVVAGMVVFTLSPDFGFSSVLLVISAASAAYILAPLGAGLVVLGQTAGTAVVLTIGAWQGFSGLPALDIGLVTFVYGSFQGFAVLVVIGQQRETAAREQLAEANAELQAATALLAANSRNDERLRIARELHDLVGHQLTALALNLEAASHQAPTEQQASVARARLLAKDLLGDVRAAVGDLRHPVPSLRAALESVVAQVPHPRIHLDMDEEVELPSVHAAAVVRCVQEIVTNAVRHSAADNLWVTVGRDPSGAIEVRAHDDGRGTRVIVAGNGLIGMRERLTQLGGELQYASTPEAGFSIAARLPQAAR